ncbi:MAG TPA: hypothetical protein VFE82_10425 [Ramlibacter sp.]|jgi:predicted membrane protein|uniref:hypothetical protein n=1 Tax=Ramlibacter sp. TaxID=1917967 RepID=UPI002D729FE1|nr:hypothetical protein [Ramlibacter sp.]HZY18887.1 hypothetical protein [Ramlibacter sp.]
MKINRAAYLVALGVALSACSQDVLTVRVLPEQYEVGEVKSRLATPAVDETVRLNPSEVQMHVCHGTPPAKAIQFETELKARYKGKVSLAFLEASRCPA